MKREHKYRAWYENKMHRVTNYHISAGMVTIPLMRFPFTQDVIPDAIIEYTGLKDSKGTEIFEGDIIAVENEGDVITVCKWDKGGFTLEDNAGGHWIRQLFHQPDRIEIIGNIYENSQQL